MKSIVCDRCKDDLTETSENYPKPLIFDDLPLNFESSDGIADPATITEHCNVHFCDHCFAFVCDAVKKAYEKAVATELQPVELVD